jgi:beta-lactam-binding protein with PASTA domain
VPEITASASITAVAPPPPCVVPSYSSSVTKQKAAEQAIRVSGCALGAVRHVASRTVRAGYVIGLSAAVGKHLPPATAVAIVVSTGPPCVVPHVSAGTALSIAERRLSANHCSVGKISATRSRRYRHGRVLRLGARTGQVLPSHAPIAIVLAGHKR